MKKKQDYKEKQDGKENQDDKKNQHDNTFSQLTRQSQVGGHKKFKNNTLKKKINFQKRSHKIYQYREPNKQSKKHKLHKLHTKSEKKTKKVYL